MIEYQEMFKPLDRQTVWFRLVASPLALIYAFVVMIRNLMFELGLRNVRTLPQPVLAVGNIAVGGTGKSPFVYYLAKNLIERGHRPVIISRGYGSGLQKGNVAIYENGELVTAKVPQTYVKPDEPRMLSQKLHDVPVVICADRYQGALFYLSSRPSYHVSHWLLDDGYQHRQLHRDFNILLLDAKTPIGNGWPIPRGLLREPLSAVKRADVIIFTRSSDGWPNLSNRNVITAKAKPGVPLLRARLVQESPLLAVGQACDLHAGANLVCAIANPDRLLSYLENSGFHIKHLLVKTDHSSISCDEIRRHCSAELPILTTEKDYWRDREVFDSLGQSVYLLPITMGMFSEDEEIFWAIFKTRLTISNKPDDW